MQSKPQIKIFHNGGWIDAVKDGVSPVLDEESIVTKVIKLIPENKPSLKIIQESIDIDLVVGKVEEKLNEKPFEISRVNGLGGRLDNITRDIARKTGYSGGGDTVAAGTGVTITTNSAGAKVINAISGSGTVTSIATAGLISGGTITTTGTITTSMATNKLVGRGTAGTGVMEEITLGTGLSFTGTTLNVTGGTGDVVGPASSTDNAIVRFDSTTGKLIQNSGVTISDTDVISTAGVLNTSMTASEIAGTDASKNIVSLPVATYPSLTELTYVKGVSSNIQTQLNAKGAGTVTSVTSANADATIATTTTTPVITIVSAPKLTTARTIGGTSFDGTANISIGALNSTNVSATTSAELAGVVSDETGTGALVFANAPALVNPTATTQSDGDNTTKVATTAFVTTAVANGTIGLLDYRGSYDASTNLFPATGGSGIAGAILKGDFWMTSVGGTLGGTTVTPGDLIIVLVDTPAQTAANWDLIAHDLGSYVTSITGTANQVVASASTGAVTLSLPQDIATSSSPQFTGVNVGHASDTTITRVSAGVIAVEGVNVLLNGGALGTPSSGVATNLTGTASGLTAGNVTTNANLTGVVTSTGNATAIADSALSIAKTSGLQTALDAKLALAGGTMSGNITLGENTSIALDPAGSADGKYTGITVTGVAGYTQAFGDLVYLAVADSRWELADADASATAGPVALAMVVVAGTDGNACTLLLQGIIRADAKFPAMTIGATQFVGETAGAIQGAIPTGADNIIRTVGYAITADELYFNPSTDWQVSVA